MKDRKLSTLLIVMGLSGLLTERVFATFHLMQIEQVIGGVNGDTSAQAIQLRMRAPGQNFLGPSRIRVWDANGMNPVVVVDFPGSVPSGGTGRRVLIASPNFSDYTTPPVNADFTLTSLIPASYLAAGSMTFETDSGAIIYWRLSWGGDSYTGSNSGAITNDSDGDFGPPFAGPLPSSDLRALLFQGSATASSSNNMADYALTAGAAVFTNNSGSSFTVTAPAATGACCNDTTGTCTNGTTQAACDASGFRYGGDDSDCATIDPPCSPPLPPPIEIGLELVADGLTAPVSATHAGDGSGRLFIVDQVGQIRIVDADGALLPEPFLDLTDRIVDLGEIFDERGVLGMAFHPDYASNGRFFVRYSAPREGDPAEPCNDPEGFVVGCHTAVLAEYAVSDMDPNVADPESEMILFEVDEPQFNHDAGDVAFGPDGFLYFSLGDGGGAHDGLADDPPSHGPDGHGQNVETALGSVLRIDVDGEVPFAIPPDNPFASGPGLDEIYAYGFRNPYRFSFDDGPGGDGALYLGDVGQDLFEEVDIVVNGGNYGWVIREGANCFDPFNPGEPPAKCPDVGPFGEPLIDPVSEYTHEEGGISVIGGFVYRGAELPELAGKYVYGDFSAAFFVPSGRLYYFDTEGPNAFVRQEFRIASAFLPFGEFLKGFGEDEDGELYVCSSDALAPVGNEGRIYRIVQAGPCQSNAECSDRNECTFDRCDAGACSSIEARFGDTAGSGVTCGPDGEIDIFDIFAVLDGFGRRPPEGCDLSNLDLAGESGSCGGDGVIDIFDIFAVLDAFSRTTGCCVPG